jgi:isopentenyl diphosphate isomerase/L-lactate dehydrogenase-like FMN-dependent dehydrogenase
VNINDLRGLAKERLPKAVFDYLDGGAEPPLARTAALSKQSPSDRAKPWPLVSAICEHGCWAQRSPFPAILAPVGYSRLMHPGGEVAAARAAGKAGTGYILSTISGHKLEDVKAGAIGPVWYQLYLVGGRKAAEGAIERARAAGFSALVITIDTPVAGMRERDPRNGMVELLTGNILPKFHSCRRYSRIRGG